MRAGLLNKVIKIYTPTINSDNFGADKTSDILKFDNVRAAIKLVGGGKEISVGASYYNYDYEIKIRSHYSIEDSDIVLIGDDFYYISSIDLHANNDIITMYVSKKQIDG